MQLIDSLVQSFSTKKLFNKNKGEINCIDFSPDGELLITSSDDDSIDIYECNGGIHKSNLFSRKYGVDLIRFDRHGNNVVHSSTKINDTIRYLSLKENRYIHYFHGHSKRVVSLSMSPIGETFLSGSMDKTLRIWDIRAPKCYGTLTLPGSPVLNYDPEGVVMAVGTNSDTIKLYDLRLFEQGPFKTIQLSRDDNCSWRDLRFSPNGRLILLSTNGEVIHLVDAFDGILLHNLTGHTNKKGLTLEASFTPDSRYVLGGSDEGKIYVWNAFNGKTVSILNSRHVVPPQCVKFNSKYMMFASACSELALWLPTENDLY